MKMVQPVKIRTAYENDYVDPGIKFLDPSLTVQSERDNCDINVIIQRFEKTGVLPQMVGSPVYGDFSSPVSYQEAIHIVQKAEAAFMGLDAKTRREFDNDPQRFLEFVNDPANAEKLIEMGLREKPKNPPPADEKTPAPVTGQAGA